MIKKIIRISSLLNNKEQKQVLSLLVKIISMAIIDTIGVASIFPFFTVLTEPEIIKTNEYLNYLYTNLKFTNESNFLIFMGILLLVILISSMSFKGITVYSQLKVEQLIEFSVCERLLKKYLMQPYSWFLNKNTAEIGNNLLKEVNQVVRGVLAPIISIIAQGLLAILMIIIIIYTDPIIALIALSILSISYGLLYLFLRGYVYNAGITRLDSSQIKHKMINEVFYGIKDVKVNRLEGFYHNLFSNAAEKYALSNAKTLILMQLPRFLIESIFFGGIIFVSLVYIQDPENLFEILPSLAVIAFAGYKLIPALQLIYANFIAIRSVIPSLNLIYHEMDSLSEIKKSKIENRDIEIEKEIKIQNLSYTYPFSKTKVIKKLNMKIPAKQTVGIIGKSGSGKTTIIDLILGLLKPSEGKIYIDNFLIDENNIESWQRNVGYVPQQTFLIDDTISSNIAFGIEKEKIDFSHVEKVAKIANLDSFIMTELEKGYSTIIGERGIRLSGGQRQRIGIARALYSNPNLLILDEATNALDKKTEEVILNALKKLKSKITIIIISHHLSTLRDTDKIFVMDQGIVKSISSYERLIQ
jgi:ATP-binding cassette, subfamily B, bacterial PglK